MVAFIKETAVEDIPGIANLAESNALILIRKLWRTAAIIAAIVLGLILASWIQILLWAKPSNIPSVRINTIRLNLKQWWLGFICRILGLKIHRQGGPWTGTVLMACNHISWLDIPILATSVPFHFLAKSEIRTWPIIGWLAAVTGTLFIRRGSGDSRSITRQLSCYLNQNNSILFFPEGTTSNGRQVLPFHSRLFHSAITSDVVIQPITLAYCEAGRPHSKAPFVGDDSLVPHIWQILGEKRIHVHLQYHPPVKPHGMDTKELAKATESTIAKGLDNIFPLEQVQRQITMTIQHKKQKTSAI